MQAFQLPVLFQEPQGRNFFSRAASYYVHGWSGAHLGPSGGQFIMTALEALFILRFPRLFLLQAFLKFNNFKYFPHVFLSSDIPAKTGIFCPTCPLAVRHSLWLSLSSRASIPFTISSTLFLNAETPWGQQGCNDTSQHCVSCGLNVPPMHVALSTAIGKLHYFFTEVTVEFCIPPQNKCWQNTRNDVVWSKTEDAVN